MALRSFCVKVNLGNLYDSNNTESPVNWEEIDDIIAEPIYAFLHKRGAKIIYKSLGVHDFNKDKGVPHVHINCVIDTLINNPLQNYKYFLSNRFPKEAKPEAIKAHKQRTQLHFSRCKHSIKHECYEPYTVIFTSERDTHILGLLAYPLKEVVDPKNRYKAPPLNIVHYGEYTQEQLIAYGSARYKVGLAQHQKKCEAEEQKMEKWSNFCKFMDDLRETPTKYQMGTLRGVCLIALDHYRSLPERTSVNAVITMCKDYAFKRNIWTNNEILDKYNII